MALANFSQQNFDREPDKGQIVLLVQNESGYKNFCVIENFINGIEWLYLAAKGHRRAYFEINENKVTKMYWKIP